MPIFATEKKELMHPLPGSPAPDFSLYDSDKNLMSLSTMKGSNVVLLFFPLAFSRVCTAELCSVRDNLNVYGQLRAQVAGISVDSLYTLSRFRQDQQLNFPLLSDFNKEVSAQYGVLYETFSYGMKGVSKRAAFIIDKEGVIRHAEVLEDAGLQPDFNAIQQVLATLNAQHPTQK